MEMMLFLSFDQGRTWSNPLPILSGQMVSETDFVELPDGHLLFFNNTIFATPGRQMVYREGGAGSGQGLTPWAALTFAPIERVNTLPLFAAGGLVYRGLVQGRDDDTTNLGVYYGAFSDDLPDQRFETVLEVNHRFQLTPWLYATPDFQYVFRPGGSDEEPDAAVLGAEIGVDF